MLQRTVLDICGVIAYTILLVLFFVLEEEMSFDADFDCVENKCYRFCCQDEKLCDNKFVMENFNSTYRVGSYWFDYNEGDVENLTMRMIPFFGKPKCFLKETDSEKGWNLEPVS